MEVNYQSINTRYWSGRLWESKNFRNPRRSRGGGSRRVRTFYRAPQRALYAARSLYENSGSACFLLHRSTVKLKNYRIRTIIRGFYCHTFLIWQHAWGWTFWGWRAHSQNLTIGFLFSSGYREVLASTLHLSKIIKGSPASL